MVIQSLGQGYYKVEDKTRGKVFQLLCYFSPPTSMGRSRTSHLKLNERGFKEISLQAGFLSTVDCIQSRLVPESWLQKIFKTLRLWYLTDMIDQVFWNSIKMLSNVLWKNVCDRWIKMWSIPGIFWASSSQVPPYTGLIRFVLRDPVRLPCCVFTSLASHNGKRWIFQPNTGYIYQTETNTSSLCLSCIY